MYRIGEKISNDILTKNVNNLINEYDWDLLVDTIEKMISNYEERKKDLNLLKVNDRIKSQGDLLKEKLRQLTTNK